MVKQFSEDQLEEIKGYFRSLPTFKDGVDGGTIHPTDLPAIILKIGFNRTAEELNTATTYITNRKVKSGHLTLEEFIGACRVQHNPAAFAKFGAQQVDADGDGFISDEDLHAMRPFLAAYEPLLKELDFTNFFQQADTNKDGKVSIDEAANWIEESLQGRVTST